MASKKKNFWYVLVMTETGPTFVTKINHSDKTAMWDKNEVPLEMGEYMAKDLAMGLCANLNSAYAVCHFYELDHQPYMYNIGHLEWVSDKEGKK